MAEEARRLEALAEAAGTACMVLGTMRTWQGILDEAEPWIRRAERTVTAEAQAATGHVIRYLRGLLKLTPGRDADALAAFRAAEPLARRLAELGSQDRDHGETRIATAVLRLA